MQINLLMNHLWPLMPLKFGTSCQEIQIKEVTKHRGYRLPKDYKYASNHFVDHSGSIEFRPDQLRGGQSANRLQSIDRKSK